MWLTATIPGSRFFNLKKMIEMRISPYILMLLLVAACSGTAAQSIVNSLHNLSASGPGDVRALSETEICIFCHTPHNSLPWIATDSKGHIYVADALFHAVQIFDGEGRFLSSFGSQGQERGEFWMPSGLFIDKQDHIYVADSYNSRVQIFQLEKND